MRNQPDVPSEVPFEIQGTQFGVRFVHRNSDQSKDKHICIQLLSEDDENWHKSGQTFSSFWLADLIDILSTAKAVLDEMAERVDFGYDFPEGQGQDHTNHNAWS